MLIGLKLLITRSNQCSQTAYIIDCSIQWSFVLFFYRNRLSYLELCLLFKLIYYPPSVGIVCSNRLWSLCHILVWSYSFIHHYTNDDLLLEVFKCLITTPWPLTDLDISNFDCCVIRPCTFRCYTILLPWACSSCPKVWSSCDCPVFLDVADRVTNKHA